MLVDLVDVVKRYGPIEALRGVTSQFQGKRIGLLGPNGAGKSSLLKVLLGLAPFQGSARVLGFDPREAAFQIRDRVGYMPEVDCTLPHLNAVELCAYAGRMSGLPRAAAMQRAHAALYYAGLEDKRYQPVEGYSTGMKQRVKLAQALVHGPELLFLDEPTSGLDPRGREEMLQLISELPERHGSAVILSTHLLHDVERTCDQVVVLHEGRLVFAGSVPELVGEKGPTRYEVRVKEGIERLVVRLTERGCEVEPLEGLLPGVAVRLPGDADPSLILTAAVASSVQLRHLCPLRVTLEAAFLRAVS
ncbi:MAG: ABC transporter ATP-binding protein [Deltaproteobacteria bacterium]|nr:ABC transporter ATP-binding protein [Deltaproteobacteria bacterium]